MNSTSACAEPSEAQRIGYSGLIEAVFKADHPEVIRWTQYFHEAVSARRIFERFEAESPRSEARARAVGPLWHRFSAFMPWFLCQAAAKVSTNEKRHYVIQGAFEELGMRDAREIHPDMFRDVAKSAGALDASGSVLVDVEAKAVLDGLRAKLLSYETDEEVLGVLLGLEIPAVENIEAIFQSLGHTEAKTALIERHRFFRIHRQIETEHVRMTISNFLRFCASEGQKELFKRGFNDGVEFWDGFWRTASAVISKEAAVARA